jgi:3-oxoacyl-[acyl-carrier protein] reductase
MSLQGRSALVTGGSLGLGLAIARALLDAGARVWLVGRSEAGLAEAARGLAAAEGRLRFSAMDLAAPGAAQRLAKELSAGWGGLDILVNNAAAQGPIGPFAQASPAAVEDALRTDLLAPMALTQALLPLLRGAKPRGKVVNVSGGGATGPRPNYTAYAVAKTGLLRFTENLAAEEPGLDVNAIAPGAMNTRMLEETLAAGPQKVGEAEYRKALAQRERGGSDPARAAALAVFLAGAGSNGISGRLLSAQWDNWEALAQRAEALRNSDIYTLRRVTPKDRGLNWGDPA